MEHTTSVCLAAKYTTAIRNIFLLTIIIILLAIRPADMAELTITTWTILAGARIAFSRFNLHRRYLRTLL